MSAFIPFLQGPQNKRRETHRRCLIFTPLQDLNHAFVFIRRAEFVLQKSFAGSVKDTLSSVSIQVTSN